MINLKEDSMAEIKLNVEERETKGSIKARAMRREQQIPGVIYGQGKDAVCISIIEKELDKAYLSAGSSTIIHLVLDDESIPVLFKDVTRHPYKNQYTHVDFYKVDMAEELRVEIPIVLEGRDEIILQPSVLAQALTEVEIECLPADIPHTASYNVIDMQYGDTVLVEDLDIYGDDRFTFLSEGDELVASLIEPEEEIFDEDLEGELEEVDAADVPTVGETEEDEEEAEEEEEE